MINIYVDRRLSCTVDDDADIVRRKVEELTRWYPGANITTKSETARALGSIRTPRKSASSAANLAKAHAARTPKPCTCGQEPHRYTCPAAKREYQRKSRERKVLRDEV